MVKRWLGIFLLGAVVAMPVAAVPVNVAFSSTITSGDLPYARVGSEIFYDISLNTDDVVVQYDYGNADYGSAVFVLPISWSGHVGSTSFSGIVNSYINVYDSHDNTSATDSILFDTYGSSRVNLGTGDEARLYGRFSSSFNGSGTDLLSALNQFNFSAPSALYFESYSNSGVYQGFALARPSDISQSSVPEPTLMSVLSSL